MKIEFTSHSTKASRLREADTKILTKSNWQADNMEHSTEYITTTFERITKG